MGRDRWPPKTGCVDEISVVPGSIVVAVDGSDDSRRAVDWAADQAAAEGRSLTVVTVVPPTEAMAAAYLVSAGVDVVALKEEIEADNRRGLLDVVDHVAATHAGVRVHTVLTHGDAREALIGACRTAHLLVMGSRGLGGFGSLLLGSVSLAVTRHAACPVVVVRPTGDHVTGHAGVLVGVDGTPNSVSVLEFAFQHASQRGLPLTVMHCFWEVGGLPVASTDQRFEDLRLLVAESVAGLAEKYPDVLVTTQLRRGLVDTTLGEEAEHHDLVVVGGHPRGTLWRLLLGSVSDSVLEHAHSPVAIVPEPPGQPPYA